MKIIGNPPEWATELFTRVCKDYNRGLPSEFIWRNRNSKYSSGATNSHWRTLLLRTKTGKQRKVKFYGYVRVCSGTYEQDQRLVLLHELAHHIVGRSIKGRREGHSMRFWKLAFELYDNYGVDMDYAIDREKGYKVKASQAYAHHMTAKMEEAK